MYLKDFDIKSGLLRIDIASRKIFVKNNLIYLRNKELHLLSYFIINMGKVLTRTQLLEDVWDRNICCNTNTVDVHVSHLRQKLRLYMGRDVIKTVYCVGYLFEL